jgi:hypothetical protein
MGNNYNRTILLMIAMMIVFAIIFLIAFVGLQRKESMVDIRGIPVEFENWIIMVLSVGSMIKIVWELHKIKNVQ